MNPLDNVAQDLKKTIVENQPLDRDTEELKKEIERDLEGDFNASKLDTYLQNRKAIVMGNAKSLYKDSDKAAEQWQAVKDREKEESFKQDKEDDVIDAKDYNELRKALMKYMSAYSQAALLFYGEYQTVDKLEGLVNEQKIRNSQSQFMDMMQDQWPKIMKNAVEEGTQVRELRKKQRELDQELEGLQEKLDSVEENGDESRELKSRVEELSSQVQDLKLDVRDRQLEDTRVGNGEPEKEELSPKLQELYDMVQDNPEKSENWYLDQFEQSDNVVKSWAGKIRNKGYQQFTLE